MKKLNQDLKSRSFAHVYLLYGEEAFLRRSYRSRLIEAIVGEDTMNLSRFAGEDAREDEICSLAETLPFFSERRLIVVEDSGFFRKSAEMLADELTHLPESTYMVFSESSVDKRGKLYKTVAKEGYCAEFARQSENDLLRWLAGIFKQENLSITRDAGEQLIFRVGTDMSLLRGEADKLIAYCLERGVVTADDVQDITSEQITGQIFTMVDALADQNLPKALSLYRDLLFLKEPPLRILFLLARQFHMLNAVKESGYLDDNTLAKQLGAPSFAVRKYRRQAGRFSEEELIRALQAAVQTEEDVKQGRMEDRLALELFMTEVTQRS